MEREQQVVLPDSPGLLALDETTQTLIGLVTAMEQRDGHVAGHCERLAYLGVTLGMAMGLEGARLEELYRGGYLHDIGKIGMPDSILFKPGRLTAQEWVTMQSHPARGEAICRPLKSLAPILPLIRHHHERWDGSGYPDGLRGEEIPLLARILQVADIYDALTNPRTYKEAFSGQRALEILQSETDQGWRDPRIVKTFVRVHERVIAGASNGTGAITDDSLAHLRNFLAAAAGKQLNDRISFRPLPRAPASDFQAEAEGTWHRE
jgi:putative two-component system response regulator